MPKTVAAIAFIGRLLAMMKWLVRLLDSQVAQYVMGTMPQKSFEDVIAEVARSGDLRRHVFLWEYIETGKTERAAVVFEVFAELVKSASNDALFDLLSGCLWCHSYCATCFCGHVRNCDVRQLPRPTAFPVAVIGAASAHHSGYVRQAAVESLAEFSDGSELPFLIMRLADWVDPICEISEREVMSRICDEYLVHWERYLPLLGRLMLKRRGRQASVFQAVVELFCQTQHSELVQRVLSHSGRRLRRAFARAAFASNPAAVSLVCDTCRLSADPILRFWAAQRCEQALAGDALDAELHRLMGERLMPVRRIGLLAYARRHPERVTDLWLRSLMDPHRSVRELSRFELRAEPLETKEAVYLEELQANGANATALRGLHELSAGRHREWFDRVINHRMPTVRSISIQALLSKAEPPEGIGLTEFLNDPSPRVCREVSKAFIARRDILNIEAILNLARRGLHPHACRPLVEAIASLGKWPSLSVLIQLTGFGNETLRDCAITQIRHWLSPRTSCRNFTQPSAIERSAIDLALAGSDVPDDIRARL